MPHKQTPGQDYDAAYFLWCAQILYQWTTGMHYMIYSLYKHIITTLLIYRPSDVMLGSFLLYCISPYNVQLTFTINLKEISNVEHVMCRDCMHKPSHYVCVCGVFPVCFRKSFETSTIEIRPETYAMCIII